MKKIKMNKYNLLGIIVLVLMALIILLVVLEEMTSLHGFFVANDRRIGDALSMTILQITASMSAITISLIAIMSGMIDEEYAGINLVDYILNIKPFIFKQYRIIVLSIVDVAAGVAVHITGRYTIVMAFLWFEAVLILISLRSIYAVFGQKYKFIDEIKAYVVDKMTDADLNKSLEISRKFQASLCQSVKIGDFRGIEEYQRIFLEVLKEDLNLLRNPEIITETGEYFKRDGDLLQAIIEACRKTDNKRSSLYVLKMLEECITEVYCRLESQNKLDDLSALEKFHPIDYGNYDVLFRDLVYKLKPIEVENSDVDLFEMVRKLAVLEFLTSKNVSTTSIASVLLECLAHYLKRERENGEYFNRKYWTRIFSCLAAEKDPVADKYKSDFEWCEVELCIAYAYALMHCGLFDLIREGAFKENQSSFMKPDNKCIMFVMAVQAYLYYLEKENYSYIDELHKKKCKEELLQKDEYQYALHSAIDNIKDDFEDCALNTKYLIAHMRKYDAGMSRYGARETILEATVRDFCVFSRLYVDRYPWTKENFNLRVSDLWHYFVGDERTERTKKDIHGFIEFMKLSDDDKKEEAELTEELFDNLHNYVVEKYKEQDIQKAHEDQRDYLSKDIEALKDGLAQQLKGLLSERLSLLMCESQEKDEIFKEVCVAYLTMDTKRISDECLKSSEERIIGQIYSAFIDSMTEQGILDVVDRKNAYRDDEQYMNDLSEKGYDVFTGSEFLYRNKDWRLSEQFREKTKDATLLPIRGTKYACVAKKGFAYFRLTALNVNIEPVGLERLSMPEADEYPYEPIAGLKINYTKEELKDYLNNRYKRVTVSVRLAMQFHGKQTGMIFEK